MLIDLTNHLQNIHHRTNFSLRARISYLFRQVIKTLDDVTISGKKITNNSLKRSLFSIREGPLLNRAFGELAYRLIKNLFGPGACLSLAGKFCSLLYRSSYEVVQAGLEG